MKINIGDKIEILKKWPWGSEMKSGSIQTVSEILCDSVRFKSGWFGPLTVGELLPDARLIRAHRRAKRSRKDK